MQMRVPEFYHKLINWDDPSDSLRLLVEPSEQENDIQSYELNDPIGDHTHEPVPGLVHRYPDRCLLLLTTHCSIHCRFCFRRDVIGVPMPVDIVGIEAYIRSHPEIHELIFSGGDPATLPAGFIGSLIDRLGSIPSIDTWRFHTRAMVADPESISNEWIAQLDRLPFQKVVVLHVDHAREVTSELATLVRTLQSHGVLVLSQSVLLKRVNDSVEALSDLFRSLSRIGVKPYYLHHLDKARGTHHFRLSIEDGKKLYMGLRGKIAGYCIPEYVVDLSGGDGKVPVSALRRIDQTTYEVENFEGRTIRYTDPLGV